MEEKESNISGTIEVFKRNRKPKHIPKKNHWTVGAIDESLKKINNYIYERNRQAPILIKFDDMAHIINYRISRRGIAKGLVCIQEDLNMAIIEAEKRTLMALLETDNGKKYEMLLEIKGQMMFEIWADIRFLMINRAITPGEITDLIRRQKSIDEDLDRWINSVK